MNIESFRALLVEHSVYSLWTSNCVRTETFEQEICETIWGIQKDEPPTLEGITECMGCYCDDELMEMFANDGLVLRVDDEVYCLTPRGLEEFVLKR